MTEPSPYDLAGKAAEKLAELTGVERHDVALVLGSGWLPAAEMLGETVAEVATTDLPGFSAAAVAGHSGKIRSVRVGDLPVRLMWSLISTGVPGVHVSLSPPQPLVSTMVRQPALPAVRTPCTTAATPLPS